MKTYLIIFCVILFSSCEKQENSSKDIIEDNIDMIEGKIVGYLKCAESETNNTLIGLYIISNNADSLLSFNVPSSILDLYSTEITYGVNQFNGDSIQFNFRSAYDVEKKQFDCPPSIFIYQNSLPLLDFNQVVITDINIIP